MEVKSSQVRRRGARTPVRRRARHATSSCAHVVGRQRVRGCGFGCAGSGAGGGRTRGVAPRHGRRPAAPHNPHTCHACTCHAYAYTCMHARVTCHAYACTAVSSAVERRVESSHASQTSSRVESRESSQVKLCSQVKSSQVHRHHGRAKWWAQTVVPQLRQWWRRPGSNPKRTSQPSASHALRLPRGVGPGVVVRDGGGG
jgi:hypothetical protein